MHRKITILILVTVIIALSLLQCGPTGPDNYELTVTAGNGGSIVTPSTSPITVISDQATDIIAEADSTYAFINWTSNDDGVVFGDASSISTTVTLTSNNATVTANFQLDASGDVIYVDASYANGDSTGTALKPFTNIEAGITEAQNQSFDAVYVATGTYDVTGPITLIEGISIYGGFSNNTGTWTRNPYQTETDRSTHLTQITYTGTDDGASENPSRAIEATSSSITEATIVEGFTILSKDTGSHVSAIYCDGANPSIAYNTINGRDGTFVYTIYIDSSSPSITNNVIISGDANLIYGIYNINSANPTISNNVVNGGTGTSYAIHNDSSSPVIFNNIIIGGNGGDVSVGIRNHSQSGASIFNNIIDGGVATDNVYGIINSSSVTDIINNIIYTTDGQYRYGIAYSNYYGDATPNSLQNNDIFNCPDALYVDIFDWVVEITNIADVNSLSITNNGGNVSTDPAFADAANEDYHFSATSPTTVTEGGLDLSSDGVTDDLDGNSRTTPYSIGAYEKD